MSTHQPARTFDAGRLASAAADVLAAAGVPAAAARTVADSLVESDARGTASHGLMLVPMYVDRLRAGSVSTHTAAEVVIDLGAIAVLDARHMLGQLSGDQATALAVEKAKAHGIGLVTVRHAFHFGAAYRYAAQAAAAGCIGIAAANTRPLMPAPGGAAAVVGNNPLAIGLPRGPGEAPVLLDMALSAAALGKIRLAESEGRAIPEGWAVGPDGASTTDPATAIAGMLAPAAGPKGFGLALAVDVLTGVLSGGGSGAAVRGLYADVSVPNDCAHVFLAIDTDAFRDGSENGSDDSTGGGYDARIESLVDQVLGSPAAPGVDRVRLPGDIEHDKQRDAERDGIALDGSTLTTLAKTAADVGATWPEDLS